MAIWPSERGIKMEPEHAQQPEEHRGSRFEDTKTKVAEQYKKIDWGRVFKGVALETYKVGRTAAGTVIGLMIYGWMCSAAEAKGETDNVVPIKVKVAGL